MPSRKDVGSVVVGIDVLSLIQLSPFSPAADPLCEMDGAGFAAAESGLRFMANRVRRNQQEGNLMAKKKSTSAAKSGATKKPKNSLVANINRRKKAGISRKKKDSTISSAAYEKMEEGWSKKKAK